MDIVSHGLYGGVAFGRRSRKEYWSAFFFGIAPDLFSFGPYVVLTWLGVLAHPSWGSGQHPPEAMIPTFVHTAYHYTHSLVIFALVFGLVTLIRRRPYLPLLAWPLHILVDIPTHSDRFFATPFLWPISDFHINGISWSQPIIFFPNLVLLGGLYVWFWWFQSRHSSNNHKK